MPESPLTAVWDLLGALGTALRRGDPDGFAAGFAPGGVLLVPHAEGGLAFRGHRSIVGACTGLLRACPDLCYLPHRRYLVRDEAIEEGVLEGTHCGTLAGVRGDSRRLRVEVSGSASGGACGVGCLTVWLDLPQFWLQVGRPDAAVGSIGWARVARQARRRDAGL